MRGLGGGVDAGIRPARDGQPDLPAENRFQGLGEDAFDGAQAGLCGPPMEPAAVIGQVETNTIHSTSLTHGLHADGASVVVMERKTQGPLTLGVDCGGGGIKATVLDADSQQIAPALREPVPYPLPPTKLISIVADMANQLPPADRITLGMPGMIRHGVVVHTPHYICRSGPRTKPVPDLVEQWRDFDMAQALKERFGVPALVLNDAEVAAAGIVSGQGLEFFMTLGTGLGTALVDNGVLSPHLEISHAPMRWGLTFDDVLGEHERRRLGDSAWSRRVLRAIELLFPVLRWDTLYIGGGNASRITPVVRARIENATFVPNTAGMSSGVQAWSFLNGRS